MIMCFKDFAQVVIQGGDCILIEAHKEFASFHRSNIHFAMIKEVANSRPPRSETAKDRYRQILVLFCSVLFLIGALFEYSLAIMAFFFALILVVSKTISVEDCFKAIDVNILILTAASISIARGMQNSGLIHWFSFHIVDKLVGESTYLVYLFIYFVTMMLTILICNTTAAIMMLPLAFLTADKMGATSVKPFFYIIILAASAAFPTPYSYQTNLMVFATGGYKKVDYFRLGIPLNILLLFLTPLLCCAFY